MLIPTCRRRGNCRLCGSRELSSVLKLESTPLANAFVPRSARGIAQPLFPLELAFCRGCGHIQLFDVVDPKALFENYVYVSGTSPSFVRHFEGYADALLAGCRPPAGALALDIGSNDGTLLGFFKRTGMSVLGIDPAKDIAAGATRAGIETWPEFMSESLAAKIRRERGPATIITANNVFAHVDASDALVRAVRGLLAPEGVFAFEVSYLADVYEKTLFDTIYHEHLDYHSVAPLDAFFTRMGMQLVDVQRVPVHGGSIRGIAQLAGGPQRVKDSVRNLIRREHELGLDREATFNGYGAKIERVKQELKGLLAGLKSTGARCAGFGAPAKMTTLMYHLGIGPETVDFVVDDSPYKQGLYTPGMHIPVVAADAIREQKPDCLILLAWNFAEQIITKHARYLEQGGKFIVPLPEVRVVSA